VTAAEALSFAQLGAAFVGLAGLIAVALAAALTRSLFVLTMLVAAFGALAAVTALALSAPQAGLVFALTGAGLAPLIFLAVLLLSGRTAKPRGRGRAWITAAAIAIAVLLVLAVSAETSLAPRVAIEQTPSGALWLAALLLAAGVGGFGLLAFGERGALGVWRDGEL
jgi:hypothetical protein